MTEEHHWMPYLLVYYHIFGIGEAILAKVTLRFVNFEHRWLHITNSTLERYCLQEFHILKTLVILKYDNATHR